MFNQSTEGGTRTLTLLPELDFESNASANSATSAIDDWPTPEGWPVDQEVSNTKQVRASRQLTTIC